MSKLPEEFGELHDRCSGWRGPRPHGRGRDEAAPHCFREHGVRQQRTSSFPGRHELGNDSVPVRDEDRLAPCGQPHILAELVLEDFEADRSHGSKGSFWELPRQSGA